MRASLRQSVRCFGAELLYAARSFRLRNSFRGKEVCVLGFHRVLNEDQLCRSNSLAGIVIREATFARLLDYVCKTFHVISLEDFRKQTREIDSQSKIRCLITFDDGWEDTYTTAFPWLKKFSLPATIFVSTDLIERRDGYWIERVVKAWKIPGRREQFHARWAGVTARQDQESALETIIEHLKHMSAEKRDQILERLLPQPEVNTPPDGADAMLTWEKVLVMSQNGIDFGGHTLTHPLLVYEDDKTLERELALGKQILEDKLSKKVVGFAYPNGTWDERVRRFVQRAGYECAFTTDLGWHHYGRDPFTIPRVLIHEGNITGRNGEFSPAVFNWTLGLGR